MIPDPEHQFFINILPDFGLGKPLRTLAVVCGITKISNFERHIFRNELPNSDTDLLCDLTMSLFIPDHLCFHSAPPFLRSNIYTKTPQDRHGEQAKYDHNQDENE